MVGRGAVQEPEPCKLREPFCWSSTLGTKCTKRWYIRAPTWSRRAYSRKTQYGKRKGLGTRERPTEEAPVESTTSSLADDSGKVAQQGRMTPHARHSHRGGRD